MEATPVITYPIKERRDRLIIGGILYTVLGLALVFVGLFFGQGIFTFTGVILTIVGLGVLGYRSESRFDSAARQINLSRGWFVFQSHTDLPFDGIARVLIEKRVSTGSRFSRMDDRQYDTTINVSYLVVLETGEGTHYVVDSTSTQSDARQWAGTLCERLDVPMVEMGDALAPLRCLERQTGAGPEGRGRLITRDRDAGALCHAIVLICCRCLLATGKTKQHEVL